MEWNNTVSNFVADLIGNSESFDDLQSFMEEIQNMGLAHKEGDKWVVTLPGYEAHQ